jgi:hypothetical protein
MKLLRGTEFATGLIAWRTSKNETSWKVLQRFLPHLWKFPGGIAPHENLPSSRSPRESCRKLSAPGGRRNVTVLTTTRNKESRPRGLARCLSKLKSHARLHARLLPVWPMNKDASLAPIREANEAEICKPQAGEPCVDQSSLHRQLPSWKPPEHIEAAAACKCERSTLKVKVCRFEEGHHRS